MKPAHLLNATPNARPKRRSGGFLRTICCVLASAVCYYLATRIAWSLCFPDSKVSLFFPPHAVLLSILLLVPTRQWWAYALAAAGAHFLATQQAHWPPWYALTCELFDAVKCVAAAAGVRVLIKSPLNAITLRDAIAFVLVAVVLVPFGAAFWGAAFTVSNGFGSRYWIEWRNLGISNAVTTVVLVPALLQGAHHLFVRRPMISGRRVLEATLVGACMVAVGIFVFDKTYAGPGTLPALLYAPIPLLIWAALRFGLGGISVSMLIITFQAIWGTMRGHGPFLTQTPVENALELQLFLLMTAVPLMLLAVVIEEERQTEAATAQEREELAHLSRVAIVGEMTASLAHEVSQPLTAMIANASAGHEFLAHDNVDLRELREILADIEADGHRASDVIRGIRDMVRKVKAKRVVVDVNAVIVDVVRLARPDAYARGCELTVDLGPTLPTVLGDPVQLQQVLLNLVLNAFDATGTAPHEQCRVEIASRCVDAGMVEVSVRDRGPGLPADAPSRVFERFYSTKRDGMGMGLAIARSIVEAHSGRLAAENADGGGARFWFRIPVHTGAAAAAPT